jgi:hypothetical protein
MKMLSVLMLSIVTIPSHAQGLLGTLNRHQNSIEIQASGRTSGQTSSTPEVRSSSRSTSSSNLKCEENDQTSLPLAYVTSLIQERDGKLEISHDQRSKKLSISSGDMIGNCSNMLEWKLKRPEINGVKAYAIEVQIKKGDDCSEEGCTYKVAKVEKGDFQKYEKMVFKPTLKGFEECLQKSGVVVDGKVVPDAIYSTPVNEKFDGIEESGKLLFLSHGPATPMVKAKYGKFEHQYACDFYEQAHPSISTLLTYEDAEQARLDAEAAKLKECKVDEYGKLADFIEKYEQYSMQLGEVRDRLILEAAKKSAAAIASGKYTEDDLKVLSDFDRYVVQPKVELARALYEEALDLEGDSKKAKQEELKIVLSQISSLGQKPYFQSAHTLKLIQDGRFDEAEKLNSMKLMIEHHQRLGAKQENIVITPGVAIQRISAGKAEFASRLEVEKERYEYRTGQSTGKASYYSNLAQRMRNNIQTRTQNFNQEIQLEYQRIQQPNGYCYKYWRNTQKCIQESLERIQELQALLQHYNKVDEERAAEYDAQAKDYGELEAQGRRYVATQNGEAPAEESSAPAPQDTTVPTPRAQSTDSGVYNFNYPGSQGPINPQMMAQQQAQMTPQQYQYPMNPYANNNMFMQQNPYMGYQQPMMGQQSFGMGGGAYNFNWGGGIQQNPYMGYQQPMMGQPQFGMQQGFGQQGYWGSPYQAYSNYSVYGRTW